MIVMAVLRRILLFHLLNSVVCIPVDQFYPFGLVSPESNTRLAAGNDGSMAIFPADQTIYYFYNQPRSRLIVSSLFV